MAGVTQLERPAGTRVRFFESKRNRRRIWHVSAFLMVLAGAVVFAIPFLWMVSTSLKTGIEAFEMPPDLLPDAFRWRNYVEGWTAMPFTNYLKNTLFLTVTGTFGTVLSTSFVAYGFARLRAPGKDVLFIVLLSALMLPWTVRLIPLFIVFKQLGWVNTFLPLIVPEFFASNAFYVFILRQFMLTIPAEMDDAARIDGCGFVQIYRRVIVPMSRAAIGAVLIFSFLNHWNDFLGPLIYLNDESKWTLAIGLRGFMEGGGSETFASDWGKVSAVNVAIMMPSLLVFLAAQRLFVRGIVVTGVKG